MQDMLKKALENDLWKTHKLGDKYTMDSKPDLWAITYYPIFQDGVTQEYYVEPRALIERPIAGGIDFREVPLRYLMRETPLKLNTSFDGAMDIILSKN